MSRVNAMGIAALVACAAVPFFSGPAVSAEVAPDQPIYYANCQSGIAVIFPGQSKTPQTRDTRYTIPFYANNRAAREFYIERGGNRYSVTVVDFSDGPRSDELIVEQAAAELRKTGEVRFQAFADYDPGMPGRQLNIFKANNRQLRASIYMAYHKLVITQADADVGDNDGIIFEQSIVLVDNEGTDIDRVNGQDGTGAEPLRKFPCVR